MLKHQPTRVTMHDDGVDGPPRKGNAGRIGKTFFRGETRPPRLWLCTLVLLRRYEVPVDTRGIGGYTSMAWVRNTV